MAVRHDRPTGRPRNKPDVCLLLEQIGVPGLDRGLDHRDDRYSRTDARLCRPDVVAGSAYPRPPGAKVVVEPSGRGAAGDYATMTQREQFIEWLGDAHAMEVGLVTTLEKHIADAKGLPKLRSALSKHLAETKRHAAAMKKALAAMGGTHPVLKEGVSKLANLAAGLVTTAPRDTIVKNSIADFASEHFEIACYTSLMLTATALGEKEIAATCKAILKEEKAMASQLEGLFKYVNDTYLLSLDKDEEPRKANGAKAARGGKAVPARTATRASAPKAGAKSAGPKRGR